jgi:ComEC/Rec2-related protein
MVPVALVYGAGLLLGEAVQPPFWVLCVASLSTAALALCWVARRWVLLWGLLVLAGWTNLVSHKAIFSAHDLRLTQGDTVELATLRGRLRETPSQRIFIHDERESSRSLSELEVTHALRGTNWHPSYGQVLVLTPGILPKDYFAGQEVEIAGVLSLPPGPRAEGLFDYRAYLKRHGIYYQLKASSPEDWHLLSINRQPPWSDRFLAWGQKTMARGLAVEDESLQLLWAMALGWKTGLTNEIYEPFMRSGTMHIFAISGMHIALFAGILVQVLRLLRVPRTWCGGLIVPLIWFYTAATGWQPSAIRSTLMMTFIIGGWALSRPSDLVNSLAAAAFMILLWDPQQLFGASFQLSFFVVLSIALLVPPLQRFFDERFAADPLLPEQLVPVWRRHLNVALRWVALSMATSLAAWLGSLPLTIYYFHLFSPVTVLANLLIVPLSSLALACNLGSLMFGTVAPVLAELFNHSAWFWMESMLRLSHWSIRLPCAYFYVPALSVPATLIYYALLLGILLGPLWRGRRKLWSLGTVLVLASFYVWQWQRGPATPQLTILPLNGGFGAYAHTPGIGRQLMVDTGNSNSVQYVVTPFLHAQGVNRLPGMVLTHGDLRHVGGAPMLAEDFSVRQVFASPLRFRSTAYRRVIQGFEARPGLLRTVARTQTMPQGWTVLHPDPGDTFPQADDKPLVLRGILNGNSILLLSDLGKSGQAALLERNADLRSDILVTGLPSGGEPVSEALLEAVRPQLLVVADSEVPAWERASTKLQQRLAKSGIKVVYTHSAGAVTLTCRLGHWELRTISGEIIRPIKPTL